MTIHKKFISVFLIIVLFVSSLFGIAYIQRDEVSAASTTAVTSWDSITGYDITILPEKMLSTNVSASMTGEWQENPNPYSWNSGGWVYYKKSFGVPIGPSYGTSRSGSLILKFNNAAVGKNGDWYDVQLSYSNLKVANPVGVSSVANIVNFEDGKNDYYNVLDARTHAVKEDDGRIGVIVDIDIKILKHGTNTAVNGTFPFTVADLDMGAGTLVSQDYAESIKFNSGVKSPYYVWQGTWLTSSGTRFYNGRSSITDADEDYLTQVFTLLDASGSSITWSGYRCGSRIWSAFTVWKGSVDVVYKSTRGETLEAVSYVKQNVDVGTAYYTSQKSFTNYHFVKMDDASATPTGNVAEGTKHVIYLYERDQGQLKLNKKSAYTPISGNNSVYSLSGAVYGIYSNEACTTKVAEMTTTASGTTNTVSLDTGTYWVKEIKASYGYQLDNTIQKVNIAYNQTTTLNSEEPPVSDPYQIKIQKKLGD